MLFEAMMLYAFVNNEGTIKKQVVLFTITK